MSDRVTLAGVPPTEFVVTFIDGPAKHNPPKVLLGYSPPTLMMYLENLLVVVNYRPCIREFEDRLYALVSQDGNELRYGLVGTE